MVLVLFSDISVFVEARSVLPQKGITIGAPQFISNVSKNVELWERGFKHQAIVTFLN
jgi:hypothetical protein